MKTATWSGRSRGNIGNAVAKPSMLVAIAMLFGSVSAIWLETAWQIVAMRRLFGEPWLRSAFIIGTVATITVLAGVLLNGKTPRARYRADE